jgi:hypothetical protein
VVVLTDLVAWSDASFQRSVFENKELRKVLVVLAVKALSALVWLSELT